MAKAVAAMDQEAQSHLTLLGGFQFAKDRTTLALSRKARGLIAYLSLQPGHSRSREKIASLLWGSYSETQARTNLRQVLSEIRRATRHLEAGLIRTDADHIALNLSNVHLDVAQFETLAAQASVAPHEQALSLYAGDLLDGFSMKEEPFEDWVRMERERLRSVAITVMERLVTYYSTTNKLASCAQAATRLLAIEPLREDVHRTLMRVYAAQGRFNQALQQYEVCHAALQRQLVGLEPEPETRRLYQDIRLRRSFRMPSRSGANVDDGAAQTEKFQPKARPLTHYVKSAGSNIAYQVTGHGPIDLIYVPGWVSNLDFAWASPRFAHVLTRLGSFCRLIRIDKRGTGLSDRDAGFQTLAERADDVRAVLDAVGSKRTVLFGSSEGGGMCMLFAATYPDRTIALVLNGAFARGIWSEDYPWAKTREQVDEELAAVERDWGEAADLGNAAPSLAHDEFEQEWFAAYLRNSASPADAVSLWRWNTEIDVRGILPAIRVPALVIQRTGDRWVRVEEGRYLATHIAGARYAELPGEDHVIWGQDSDRLVDEIQAFLTRFATADHGSVGTV